MNSLCEAHLGHVQWRNASGSDSVASWNGAADQLMNWLRGLPKPVGIIGVTDARVRQLLQACILADIYVPEEVALVGIDNDQLARALTRIPLSSVMHGSHERGRLAPHTLEQLRAGKNVGAPRLLVPPAGISASASSQHQPVKRPHVMRTRHFIRQYACKGIKAEQVADFVGISRSSLETYFREALNCSVHEEILRFKLDEAIMLLASPTASITEIALRCGFNSGQYMRHVFKRERGGSPGA